MYPVLLTLVGFIGGEPGGTRGIEPGTIKTGVVNEFLVGNAKPGTVS